MSYTVYVHTAPDGRQYVGITSQRPERRWQNGTGYAKQAVFGEAIREIGWENFEHRIVAEGLTKEGAEELFEATMDEYGFVFVAQEKTPPYAVRVYERDSDFIAEGVDEFRALLGMYHHCKETGNWFGYEGEENTATMLHGEG